MASILLSRLRAISRRLASEPFRDFAIIQRTQRKNTQNAAINGQTKGVLIIVIYLTADATRQIDLKPFLIGCRQANKWVRRQISQPAGAFETLNLE